MTRRDLLRLLPGAAVAAFGIASVGLAASGPRVIRLSARRFAYTPSQLRLKLGEPVIIEAKTEDVFMGLNIPDFRVRADLVPGKAARLAFTPDKAGTFTFVCDVFCGDGHESMSGTLVVA